jgi:hypothetical protein
MGISEALVSGSSQIQQGAGKKIEASASSVSLISNRADPPGRETRGRLSQNGPRGNYGEYVRSSTEFSGAGVSPASYERDLATGNTYGRTANLNSQSEFVAKLRPRLEILRAAPIVRAGGTPALREESGN